MSPPIATIRAVVLAGGAGTRIRHLLPNLPKPMAPVAGRPFVEWVIRYLAAQGMRQAILSTGYLGDIIEKHFAQQPVPGLATRCIAETSPLGTAGGFLNAARQSGESPDAWLILNGDSLIFFDLTQMAECLCKSEALGVIVGCPVPDASRYGSLIAGRDGTLVRFAEKAPGAGVISAGVYLLRRALVELLKPDTPLSFENDLFPATLEQGLPLKVVLSREPFLDIGTEQTLRQAEAFILRNKTRFPG